VPELGPGAPMHGGRPQLGCATRRGSRHGRRYGEEEQHTPGRGKEDAVGCDPWIEGSPKNPPGLGVEGKIWRPSHFSGAHTAAATRARNTTRKKRRGGKVRLSVWEALRGCK
jgi:hypothetical protein